MGRNPFLNIRGQISDNGCQKTDDGRQIMELGSVNAEFGNMRYVFFRLLASVL